MIYASAGCTKYALSEDLALAFCRKQNKDNSILTKSHINHDQTHHIKNNWLGPIFFSPEESHRMVAFSASSGSH